MEEWLISTFSSNADSHDLDFLQMSSRAFVIFILALFYIRVGGIRAFGQRQPIDLIVSLMLGGVFGRAITGSVPFFPALGPALVLVLLHRLLAFLTFRNDSIGRVVKGKSIVLVRNGEILRENMALCMISERDLMEAIRRNGNIDDLKKVKIACFERDGDISVIPFISNEKEA